MRYLSVCSGIEAASVAWHPLGWESAAFSEIEAFPRAVLAHHYPAVPLYGDFTTIGADDYGPIDILVGGTPCQSFSIAGLRGGLDDDRGNLALEFLRLAQRTRAKWVVWENVSGVLSSNGGRDFGAILGGLVELGYGFAYRVLDAQYFGVPQRRRRVFVVGHLGDWRRAAAVLFERASLSGHPAPRREKGASVAALTANGVGTCGADDNQGQAGHLIASTGEISHCLNAGGMGRQDYETETLVATCFSAKGSAGLAGDEHHNPIPCQVAHTLRGEGFDASEDGTGRGTPLVPVVIQERAVSENPETGPQVKGWQEGIAYTLEARNEAQAVAFDSYMQQSAVRRLTPRECERLQGFPDDWTRIPYRNKPADQCPDGPRYKALGNSMAVPVMRWIGERMAAVETVE